jgi:phosphatidylserine decarboxylase
LIRRFVRKNNIRLSDYEKEKYRSFNECFTRKIKPELRPIPMDKNVLIAPCDALLSVYPIHEGSVFHIKGSDYSVKGLLGGNEELASRYAGGTCLVFRLCVHHYHRYIYLDNGTKGENVFIKGKLHTVRPIALETFPVFVQNCREYTVMETENFGTATQIEVGAMLVGKIQNHHAEHTFSRGEEKGMFLYGGSTVVLLLEKDTAVIDSRFFEATEKDEETEVKMGEILGKKHT